jgi:hypothetical protein
MRETVFENTTAKILTELVRDEAQQSVSFRRELSSGFN